MPRHSKRLSEAMDEFIAHRRANGYSQNTIRSQTNALQQFLVSTGNIYLDSVRSHHVDSYFAERSEIWSARTMNLMQSHLATFFDWCRSRRFMTRDNDPLSDTRRRRVARQDRLRIPVGEFPRLLDSARHPRDRIIVALGLFLFLRASEIRTIRLSDVHLEVDEITVIVHKSGGIADRMPICRPLRVELNRWLTYYTNASGPLTNDYFLVPALDRPPGYYNPNTGRIQGATAASMGYRPSTCYGEPQNAIHYALTEMGYPPKWEGCHTLRRSGARALFDELAEGGYDRALEVVSTMLHHQQMGTTQLYLGLQESKVRRDDLLKGQQMFSGMQPANVIPLRSENVSVS